ncbi:hypothetical protein [Algoriphagus sp.]|uniref:hypothetical protein n=1 Tax=Algoriphagus sp. TaxID=1872435 RepID=UPI0032973BC4
MEITYNVFSVPIRSAKTINDIKRKQQDSFFRLILEKREDGWFTKFIIKYFPEVSVPKQRKLQVNNYTVWSEDFTGDIQMISWGEELSTGWYVEKGEKVYTYFPKNESGKKGSLNANAALNCTPIMEEVCFNFGDDEEMDCSSGTCVLPEFGIECFDVIAYEDPKCSDQYNPGSGAGTYTGPTGPTPGGGSGSGSGGGGPYIPSDEELIDEWEDQIDDTQLNPCIKDILIDLKSLTTGVGNIVSQFAGDTPGYNWVVKSSDTGLSNASTSTSYNNGVSTSFSSTNLSNATDISIARTILHESVHAYFVTVQNLQLTVEEKSVLMGDNWFSLVPKLVPNQGHALFASNFVDKIAISLYEYGQLNGLSISLQYYKDLAWGGLTHYDPSGNNNYVLSPWFQESVPSSSDRSRILNIINNEQNGESGKKGNDAGC